MKCFVLLLIVIALLFSGCSSDEVDYRRPGISSDYRKYLETSYSATHKPQSMPTLKPDNIPQILSFLHSYYIRCKSSYCYQIEQVPQKHAVNGHEMVLTCKEVPDANGSASIIAFDGSSDIEIKFSYSNFMGVKVCSPTLIRDVCTTVVRAFAEHQGISDADQYVDAVINSYDGKRYTSVVEMGDYAFVFGIEDIYAAELTIKQISKFRDDFVKTGYSPADYSTLSSKLNAGSDYNFEATVISVQSSEYRNSFSKYQCIEIVAQMDNGETIKIVQNPQNVPLNIVAGVKYTFYGSPMYDISDSLLFYLHYAE